MARQNHISITESYKLFCFQLKQVVVKYPDLRIRETEGIKYLKGILNIPDDDGNIVGNFLIEVHLAKDFPYRFPYLLEIGGLIPNEADWHKYSNSGCCITVDAKEKLVCRNGLHLIEFIETHAIGFFANFIFRKENGHYKNGDYGHGIIGLDQFYTEILKTPNRKLWWRYFENVFKNLSYNNNRNDPCFCDSGKKFKHCHKIVFNDLREIGEDQVLKDLGLFFKYEINI